MSTIRIRACYLFNARYYVFGGDFVMPVFIFNFQVKWAATVALALLRLEDTGGCHGDGGGEIAADTT